MARTFQTHSGSQYTTTPDFDGTVLSVTEVNGNVINPNWKKPIRLITLNIKGKLTTFVSEEKKELTVGALIRTHATINKDGVKFLSLRHIK